MPKGLLLAATATATAAVLAAAGAAYALLPGEAAPDPGTSVRAGSRVVLVATVHAEPPVAVRRLPGIIEAKTEADLAFRVGGKMLSRTVSIGDKVRAGEVVATLDEVDLRLELEAAEAERAAASVALEKAQIDLARVTELQSNGWVSDEASDLETVAAEEARARLLRADRAAELARNRLGYATLRAEADGVVTETMAESGQVVAAGQPVVRIAHATGREAVVAVPEAMLAGIRAAEPEVELWSDPGRTLPATLSELSPVADGATRTFEARFALDETETAAALGMSVTVSLARPAPAPAITLALPAVLDTGAGPQVWVVGADDRLEARTVTVAGYGDGEARIVDGLADGERVVVLGAHKLQAGEQVRPVEAEG